MFENIKIKLIKFLLNGSPLVMNCHVNGMGIKKGYSLSGTKDSKCILY
jgi:hypothetical protein